MKHAYAGGVLLILFLPCVIFAVLVDAAVDSGMG